MKSAAAVALAAATCPLATAAAVPPATNKLKVLCLHGYSQTGAVLRDRSGGFRKPMKKGRFAMTYPNGPYGCTAQGEDILLADADLTRRAWWRGHSGLDSYEGWREASESLNKLWDAEDGGFDGILGFSQGAAAAAMLRAERRPKFAILVSGFVPRDTDAAQALLQGVEGIPTLHFLGLNDTLVVPSRSNALADLFEDATVVEHAGGHCLPSGLDVRPRVVEFLRGIEHESVAAHVPRSGAGGSRAVADRGQ